MEDHSNQSSISPKVDAHDGSIVFRQAANDLLAEVVSAGGHAVSVSLLEGPPALFDVFLEPVIEILVFATLGHLGLVIQLYFIHQQPGKAPRLAMDVGILGRQVGKWIRRRRRGGSRGGG